MTSATDTLASAGRPRGTGVRWSLAIISFFTAVIHFAVAGEHFQEWWLFGILMLVAAWGQVAVGVAAILRPSRTLWVLAAGFNAGIVIYYLLTRTVGDLIGPTPLGSETLGFGDGACTIAEILVVIGCLWLVSIRDHRIVPSSQVTTLPFLTGLLVIVALSVALIDGGPEMVMQMSGSSSSSGTGSVASISLPTNTPGGNITMQNPNTMQMPPGMKMASSTACTATPTATQQQAAVTLVEQSWAADQTYRSLAAAKSAGYVPITRSGAPVVHYLSESAYEATANGGAVLDTQHPQSLVYANTPHGAVLVAAMYITPQDGNGSVPDPGGCLTQWHIHTNLCMSDRGGGFKVVGVTGGLFHRSCPAGSVNRDTSPMLHVWFVPLSGGPLVVDASNRDVVAAAEKVSSPANGTA